MMVDGKWMAVPADRAGNVVHPRELTCDQARVIAQGRRMAFIDKLTTLAAYDVNGVSTEDIYSHLLNNTSIFGNFYTLMPKTPAAFNGDFYASMRRTLQTIMIKEYAITELASIQHVVSTLVMQFAFRVFCTKMQASEAPRMA